VICSTNKHTLYVIAMKKNTKYCGCYNFFNAISNMGDVNNNQAGSAVNIYDIIASIDHMNENLKNAG